MKQTNKLLTYTVLILILLASFCTTAFAAGSANVVSISGDEKTGDPFAQSSWDEFYNAKYFVWFHADFDISCTLKTSINNPQADGDDDLKPGANDLIKLNGRTIKKINDSLGDPYAAMVAYESNMNGKLRLSIWLSQARSVLFNTDRYKNFSIELLEGLKVPTAGYVKGNGKVITVNPAKYQISIADLKYKSQKTNINYNASKADWLKPMYEELTSEWEKIAITPVTQSTTVSTKSSTSSSSVQSGTMLSNNPTVTTQIEKSSAVKNDIPNRNNGVILPVILIVIGVILIVGMIAFFVFIWKQQKLSAKDISNEDNSPNK